MKRFMLLAAILQVLPCLSSCGEMSNPYAGEEGLIILHNYVSQDPKGFDPCRAGDALSNSIMGQIYDRLYQYSYLERPYKLEPCVADGMYELSEDRLTCTIKIKKGIYYADDPCFPGGKGRELVAQDFILSWKRISDVNNDPEGYWIFKGYIAGLDEFNEASQEIGKIPEDEREKWKGKSLEEVKKEQLKELYARDIEGFRALDRYTIQIKLTKPYPRLPLVLTMNYTAPVAWEALEYYGEEFLNHPIGTGPFKLKRWEHWHKIVLEKNPGYREDYYPEKGEPDDAGRGLLEDAGKRLPLADEVVYTVIKQEQPAWLYFLSGYVDYAGIPKDSFNSAMSSLVEVSPELEEKGIQLWRHRRFSVFYIAFNMNDPTVGLRYPEIARRDVKKMREDAKKAEKEGDAEEAKNLRERADRLEKEIPGLEEKNGKRRKLRQAMSLALNRPARIKIFANGRASAAHGPIPPNFPFYDENFRNPYSEFDLEKARELIAEAGYPGGIGPDGEPLSLQYETTGTSTTTMQMADFFRQEMGKIGIEMKIQTNTWTEFQEKLNGNRAQVFGLSWLADYGDPQNFLQLFYGPNKAPSPNNASYENPHYDKLHEEMEKLSNFDPEESRKKWELCREMEKVLSHDAPWIFGLNYWSYTLVHRWRRNFKPHQFADNTMKYQRVDPDLRMKLSREWNRPTRWPAYIAIIIFMLFVGMFAYKVKKQSE